MAMDSKDDLQNMIRKAFDLCDDTDLLVQSWNETFQDWVDLDSETLDDSGKLQVFVMTPQSRLV